MPLQGSNLDFPDPESGVLPVTPRGTEYPFPIAGSIPPRAGRDYNHHFSRSGRRGSNPRPSAWEADALPTELLPQDPAEFTAVKPLSARSARRTELLPQDGAPAPSANVTAPSGPRQSHRSDLNRRPLDYESSALPLSYGGTRRQWSRGESNP